MPSQTYRSYKAKSRYINLTHFFVNMILNKESPVNLHMSKKKLYEWLINAYIRSHTEYKTLAFTKGGQFMCFEYVYAK